MFHKTKNKNRLSLSVKKKNDKKKNPMFLCTKKVTNSSYVIAVHILSVKYE